MNPDYAKTPREELEARLTALLLGELSSEEAAATRRAIERDAKLAEMFQQLRVTIELVQQASTGAATPGTPDPAPLRMSDDRRRVLLAHFNTVPLPKLAYSPTRKTSWLVPLAAVLVMLLALAPLVIPSFVRARNTAASNAIVNNLRQLDGAKQQWALENRAADTATPTLDDLRPYFKGGEVSSLSIAGEKYVVGRVQDDPVAVAKSGEHIQLPPAGQPWPARPDAPRYFAKLGVAFKPWSSDNPTPLSVTPIPGRQTRGDPEGAEAWDRQASSTERQVSFGDLAAAKELAATPKSPPGRAARAGSAIVLPSEESTERYKTAVGLDVAEREKVNLYSWHAEAPASAGRQAASKSESELAFVQEGIAPKYSAGTERGFLTVQPVQPPASSAAAGISGLLPAASSDGKPAVPATDNFSAGAATYGGFGRGEPLQESDRQGRELAARPEARGREEDRDKAAAVEDQVVVGERFYRFAPQHAGIAGQPQPAPFATIPPAQPATDGDSTAAPADALSFGVGQARGTIARRPTKPTASATRESESRRVAAGDRVEPQEQVHSLDVVGYQAVPLSSKDAFAVGTDESAPQKASSIVLPAADAGLALGVEPAKAREMARAKIALTRPSSGVARDENMRLVRDGRLLFESGKPEAAEKKFQEALHAEPENRAAAYYLDLAKDARLRDETQKIKYSAKMVIAGLPATENHLSEARRRSSARTRGTSVVSTENVVTQVTEADLPIRKPATNAPIPQPEIQTSDNAFSTFSLNVSDVSFKLTAASLEQGQMPDAASVRAEEFINAFDYRDPEPPPGVPVAFAWERARYPFAHNRDLLRFSLKTGAAGRTAGRPLNLVLLLDNSGSMERADRVRIIHEALRVLAGQLQPQDKLSVISFARTARLVADGVTGDKSGAVLDQVSGLTPQGGTNLEEAMNLGYATALRHYLANGLNRVVLLTDGAANLGNIEPESLKRAVETHRKQGVALDCFGIGWEGLNDDLLEVLSRNGDGRYGFMNSPEAAATEFAGQLAGALKVAASDVKVQVEFNPKRVTAHRQIGYAKHQLTKEQFRDNTVDAAEIAAQEAGNALYTVEVNPAGEGPLCIVRCRFKIPGTTDYREHEWAVPYTGNAVSLEQASPAMRLAASASAFAEWLVVSPFAAEVTPDALLGCLSGVPEVYGADARPKKLEWMIRQAKSLAGK